MIYSLHGTLVQVGNSFVVVECAGVGYGVRTTMNTIGRLPRTGNEVRLFTHLSVREDAVELFGFYDERELELFRLLTSVNGVGPKAAIAILSQLSAEKLTLCIAGGDAKTITQAPGVGPKLASRIVMELKDKLGGELALGEAQFAAAGAAAQPHSPAGEAVSALVALGYTQSDAAAAVGRFAPDTPVQEMIKGALKLLSGR